MTVVTDDDLAAFVTISAAILGLQLSDDALAAVHEAMRGVMMQAALVLDYVPARAQP